MHISFYCILFFLSLGGSVLAQTDAFVMQRALQRYSEFYGGGRDADRLTSISIEGIQVQDGKSYNFLLRKKSPDMIRYRMAYGGNTIVTAYDGSTGWMQYEEAGKREIRELSGKELEQLKEEAIFEGPLFRHLARRSNQVEMVGPDTVDDEQVYVYLTQDAKGKRTRYYLSAKDSLIVKMECLGKEDAVVMTTIYLDYREVGGFPIAHQVETLVSGEVISKTTIQTVNVNPGLLGFYFRMPK